MGSVRVSRGSVRFILCLPSGAANGSGRLEDGIEAAGQLDGRDLRLSDVRGCAQPHAKKARGEVPRAFLMTSF